MSFRKNSPSPPIEEAASSMRTGYESPEISERADGESLLSIPSSLVEVKKLARKRKNPGGRFEKFKSFEEKRWVAKQENEEISEEARKAWEVGKKLGLLSKVSDEVMRK